MYNISSLVTDAVVYAAAAASNANATADDHPGQRAAAGAIQRFSDWYVEIHGYVALVVCTLGVAANCMNCVVLTRRKMVSPTNVLLTALAIADAATMVSYLPYATYFYVLSAPDPNQMHSYWWALYMILQTNFVITCHTAAMYLTVSLAVFRSFNKWTYGVILKVVPCLLLIVLSALLVRAMKEAAERRRKMRAKRTVQAGQDACGGSGSTGTGHSTQNDRTTVMLIAIVVCFVVTEFPQGVLAFLGGLNHRVFELYYVPLGDVMDIIVLINSAVNFVLYCTMSAQFRSTFVSVFCATECRNHVILRCGRRLSDGGGGRTGVTENNKLMVKVTQL